MNTQQQKGELYIASFTSERGHTWTFSVDLETGTTLGGDRTDWKRIPILDVGLDYPMYSASLELSSIELYWMHLCWKASRAIRNEYEEQLEAANLQYTDHVREVLYDLWQILDALDDSVLADRLKNFFWAHGHQDINRAIDSMWEKMIGLDHVLARSSDRDDEENEENEEADDESDEDSEG